MSILEELAKVTPIDVDVEDMGSIRLRGSTLVFSSVDVCIYCVHDEILSNRMAALQSRNVIDRIGFVLSGEEAEGKVLPYVGIDNLLVVTEDIHSIDAVKVHIAYLPSRVTTLTIEEFLKI